MKKYLVPLMIMAVIGLSMSSHTIAATITVGAGGDYATIQEAINNASDGDIISIEDAVHTEADITIDKNLTIQGKGAVVQAHENEGEADSSKVFSIDADKTVIIRNMTIQHGKTFESKGGGISNNGTLTLVNCTVCKNISANFNGGGISNNGILTLTNCTVSGNSTYTIAGGINNDANGILTLTNCTVCKNTADGGDGGICNDGTLYIKNTILADNTSFEPNDFSSSGTVHDNGYNIVEFSSGYTFEADGDITGEQANLNLSDTLEDNNTLNGTQTLKTTTGSPAIDAGAPNNTPNNGVEIPTTDQRGANRKGTTDIGAYEYWDDEASLPVELSSFTATSDAVGTVTLLWRTESEMENLGFNIYRSTTKDGEFTKINPTLIKGHGTDATPHDYAFIDETAQIDQTYFYQIEDVDFSGELNKSHILKVTVGLKRTSVELLPKETVLMQNYPNPFNPETWIPFQLAESTKVVISIYDIHGQIVRKVGLGKIPAGAYVNKDKAVHWDGRNQAGEKVSSGVYFYTLKAGNYSETKQMLILK